MEEEKQLTIAGEEAGGELVTATNDIIDLNSATEEELNAAIEGRELIRKVAIQHSKNWYWECFDKKNSRLNVNGGHHYAWIFGVSVGGRDSGEIPEYDRDEKRNGHYQCWSLIRATKDGRFFEYRGTCDTHNRFFWRWDKRLEKSVEQPPETIDRTMVVRKAYANGIANAVGRLLNLAKVPNEALLNVGNITEINYVGGKK